MKYIKFNYIDVVTGYPCTQEIMRNGGVIPKGIEFGFALESKYPCQCPEFFGTTELNDLPSHVTEITEQEYNDALASELTARREKLINEQFKPAVYRLADLAANKYDYRSFDEVSNCITGTWSDEAKALLKWYDAIWQKYYEAIALDELPSVQDFIDSLPVFEFS